MMNFNFNEFLKSTSSGVNNNEKKLLLGEKFFFSTEECRHFNLNDLFRCKPSIHSMDSIRKFPNVSNLLTVKKWEKKKKLIYDRIYSSRSYSQYTLQRFWTSGDDFEVVLFLDLSSTIS